MNTEYNIDMLITIATALVLLILALYVANKFTKFLKNKLEKGSYTPPIPYFISTFVKVSLYVVIIISFLSKLGIPTNSFLAVIGAAGLAIGLALQSHLSNLAGGILILVFKPFKVGDRITAMSSTGTVAEVKTFFTILKTANKHTLYLPNGPLFSGVMTNHTQEGFSRVEYQIAISYNADADKASAAILSYLNSQEVVIKDQPLKAFVSELADSGVVMTVFFYVDNEIFWDIKHAYLNELKKVLDKNEIEIPFPQIVVHQATKK
jgi:small conductance mechanosensitive channel